MLHNEARKLLIQALEKSHNVREVARNYSVNQSTVYRLKKRLDETGSIEIRTYLRGRKPALTPEEVENINQLVKNRPDITMQEIIETLHLKMVDLEGVSIFPEAHSLRRADKILLGLILTVQFDQDFLQISRIS